LGQQGEVPKANGQRWNFPIEGHPTGRPAMDDAYYYTCFMKAPGAQGGTFHTVPVALDKKLMKL
jgi:hypothetical protein